MNTRFLKNNDTNITYFYPHFHVITFTIWWGEQKLSDRTIIKEIDNKILFTDNNLKF